MLRYLRNLLPYAWAAMILSMLYLVYVGASRLLSSDEIGQITQKRQGLKQAIPADVPPGFRILQFYASNGEITRGQHIVVCYGVQEARAVRLDPPVESIEPAMNRCFDAAPARTTTYTLTAEAEDGNTDQAAFTVKVNPPLPSFLFISVSDQEVRHGDPVALCYGLKDAENARLDPVGLKLAVSQKNCVQFYPQATMKFTLVATGEGGRTAKADFGIRVAR